MWEGREGGGRVEDFDLAGKGGEEVREERDKIFEAGLEGRGECLGFEHGALLVGREGGREGGGG